jgi:hypothetical protein
MARTLQAALTIDSSPNISKWRDITGDHLQKLEDIDQHRVKDIRSSHFPVLELLASWKLSNHPVLMKTAKILEDMPEHLATFENHIFNAFDNSVDTGDFRGMVVVVLEVPPVTLPSARNQTLTYPQGCSRSCRG